ncbi:MAG: histone H1 [Thermoleophilaceae bacterium]
MPRRSSTRARDLNRLASEIVDRATDESRSQSDDRPSDAELRMHAKALGRKGGLKGGKVRAERLSAERRSEIARKAAQARWSSRKG